MRITRKLAIAAVLSSLWLGGALSPSRAEYRPASVPEELIEAKVAEKPEDHATRIVAGFMHFDSGRFSKAERHFAKAANLTPNDPYDQAWLYMAQLRQDAKAADSTIRAFLVRSRSSEFVYTDIAVLLGDVSPDQAIEQARASKDPGNVCEAHYYAAQRLLANGEKQKAKEHFVEALKTKQDSYWEYKSAAAYLDQSK